MDTHANTRIPPESPESSRAWDAGAAADQAPDESAFAAWRMAADRVSEIRDYASYLAAAKLDGLKLTARRIAIFAALGIVGLIFLAALVAMAAVLLCLGISDAFTSLTGRVWLGEFIAFAILAGVLGGGVWLGLKKVTSASLKSTVEKYERLQQQQRRKRGADVRERASEVAGHG